VTIDQAAAPSNTLVFMLVGIGMLIPVMITYNIYQYVVFRGKVDPDHEHTY
jgi:cytochrome d ubiquinol oxidase subunit II